MARVRWVPHEKTGQGQRLADGSPLRSPNLLNQNDRFFSITDPFYYCHVEVNLLPIPSLSPRDGYSNRFNIKRKRAVLPPNAEKSTLRRTSSPDV
jgi:hypothetical protein